MRRQSYQEYLEAIKETNPSLYSELTEESNGDNFGCLTLILSIVVSVLFTLFLIFFGGNKN